MTESRIWTAALVVIGDEILSGRTQDRNIAQIALWLNVQGIRLKEVRVVADDREAIVEAVNVLRGRNDYLFTTGGIGPTHDDRSEEHTSELKSLIRRSYAVFCLKKKQKKVDKKQKTMKIQVKSKEQNSNN